MADTLGVGYGVGSWQDPPPVRVDGFTWLTLRLTQISPAVLVTTQVRELADIIIAATDPQARAELVRLIADGGETDG